MSAPAFTPEEAKRCAKEHGWETLLALEVMLAEWDKFTRYGSPIAKVANEQVNYARRMAAKARGESPSTHQDRDNVK